MKRLPITPLSNVWLNCYLNNMLSIILSIDPSNNYIACENNYTYDFIGQCGWYKCLSINYNNIYKFCKRLKCDYVGIDFSDALNIIKNNIDNNFAILATVDLYNWLPNNVNFHKRHANHDTLIIGYDDSKKKMYVFDDDVNGYREHTVTYECFMSSLVISNLKRVSINQAIPVVKHNIEKIKLNTDLLISSISSICYASMWNVYENYDMMMDLITEMTKIIYRQKLNKQFFEYAFKNGWINDSDVITFFEKIDEIVSDWEKIKFLTLKSCVQNDKFDYMKINNMSFNVMKFEYNLWKSFKDSLMRYENE